MNQGGWGGGGSGWGGGGNQPPGGGFGAPPQEFAPMPGFQQPGAQGQAPVAFNATDAISFGWDRVKSDPATIIGAILVASIVANLVGNLVTSFAVRSGAAANGELVFYQIGGGIINLIGQSFILGGITDFTLKVGRGHPYHFGDVFGGARWFLPILGAQLLMFLCITLGTAALIVPGIILALGLSLTLPVIVDRNVGPIEAMKTSWSLTDGHKGSILLFGFLAVGLFLLGMIPCCLGLLVVGPLLAVAQSYIYLRLSGQQTAVGYF